MRGVRFLSFVVIIVFALSFVAFALMRLSSIMILLNLSMLPVIRRGLLLS